MGHECNTPNDETICLDCITVERARRIELKRLAKEALDVQYACNLSGVLLGAHKAACSLRRVAVPGQEIGNNELAHHPIMQMWTTKIADLCGVAHTYPNEADNRCLEILGLRVPE